MPQDVQRTNNLSISNLPEKLPDYAVPVGVGLPDYAKPVSTVPNDVSPSVFDSIFKPIVNVISPEMRAKGDELAHPTLDDLVLSAQLKGFGVGATQAIGDLISSQSSPLNLGLEAATGGAIGAKGAGLESVAKMLETPSKIGGAGMVGHGIYNMINEPTFAGKAGGFSEAAMGGAGLLTKKLPDYAVPVKEQKLLGPGTYEMPPSSIEGVFDEGGRRIADTQPSIAERPKGPWTANIDTSKFNLKDPEQRIYDLTREKLNMGRDMPVVHEVPITETNKPTAKFKAWQEGFEDIPDHALYDVQGGTHNQSTVTAEGLKKLGIEVPETPKNDLEARKANRGFIGPRTTLKELLGGEVGAIRFGKNKEAPIASKAMREPQAVTIDKLVTAVTEAMPKREEQEKQYSAERAKRIQNAEKVKKTGLPGFYDQLHELKGELPKVDFERTKMSQSEVNDLINYITNSTKLLPFEKIRAKIGLLKLLSAKREELPQRNEISLLREVFGERFDPVVEMHGGFGGSVPLKIIKDVANMPKAIMASIDLSAPMRQGLPLIHKSEWWSALRPMVESFAKQENFDALQDSIKERPGYLLGKEAGLKLTEIDKNPAHREEAYGSTLANLIPGVKRSERAYVGFLNKLRADTFDSLIVQAKDAGLHPRDVMHDIANFVNVATGRGSLGPLDKIATELNTVFFSPRLIASRMTMLNPYTYVDPKVSPFVRKEALKSLLATASAGLTINGLMAAMGAKTNTSLSDNKGPGIIPGTNGIPFMPINSDFMKSRFGNTRLDPYGGFQQYVVAAGRLLSGQTQSSVTDKIQNLGKSFNAPTRKDIIARFFENKLSPAASLIDVIATGKDFEGKPINLSQEVMDRFKPMMLKDLYELYRDDPNHLPLGIGSALGMGLQTYQANQKPAKQMRIRFK